MARARKSARVPGVASDHKSDATPIATREPRGGIEPRAGNRSPDSRATAAVNEATAGTADGAIPSPRSPVYEDRMMRARKVRRRT